MKETSINPKRKIARYAILLFAGIADTMIGIFAFVLVIFRIITGLESLWVITLAIITTLTGVFLIYRILPVLLRMQREEPAPIPIDERTQHIIHQAAGNAFVFLIIALIVTISVTIALPKLGFMMMWSDYATVLLIIWIIGIFIFCTSMAYYYWK